MAALDGTKSSSRLGVLRCALTGAIVLGGLFLLCWLGAVLGMTGGSHAFLSLFTQAAGATTPSLVFGLCWSIIFGALAGGLTALVYNALGVLDRR